MNEDFIEAVHALVERIPRGHVLSYGQVAALCGSKSARGVGRVLATTGETLPWWRVVRSDGTVAAERADRSIVHYDDEAIRYSRTRSGIRVTPDAFWRGTI